ncbi:STAS domain-containing protein [Jatrophihabitans fulvus]
MEPEYALTVTSARRGAVVADVSGELDYGWVPALRRKLFDLVDDDVEVLVVDLCDVRLLSAAAMEMLLALDVLAAAAGCEVRIVASTRPVRRPLTLTGLVDRLRLYDTREAALADGVRDGM